jgi:hypothetical protein
MKYALLVVSTDFWDMQIRVAFGHERQRHKAPSNLPPCYYLAPLPSALISLLLWLWLELRKFLDTASL